MSLLNKAIFFLVGLFVLPRAVIFFWSLAIPYFSLSVGDALLAHLAFSGLLIVGISFLNKPLALGFLVGIAWDVVMGSKLLT